MGGDIFRQDDGSPMGLDTSVEGSDIYMLAWERALISKLYKLGWSLEIYKRYVDDIFTLLFNLNKGWHYNVQKDKMEYISDHPNAEQPDDLRTLTELLKIGNTLDSNIQLELDVPSLQGGKLPLLDLKVWIQNNKIRHEFYKKKHGKQTPHPEQISTIRQDQA